MIRTARARFLRALAAPLVVGLVALLAASGCKAQTSGLIDLNSFPRSQLEIRSSGHQHVFEIWLAETPEQQEQGLMFVRELAENRGMLFVSEQPRVFRMWMKNTYISLDMVFIGADGHIAKIAPRATPHSLATISSDVPVSAILELKGGEAERRGLRAGDAVSWSKTPR